MENISDKIDWANPKEWSYSTQRRMSRMYCYEKRDGKIKTISIYYKNDKLPFIKNIIFYTKVFFIKHFIEAPKPK